METNAGGLCTKGCGFFGNDAYEGMCSKCHKDNVKRRQQAPSATPASFETLPETSSQGHDDETTTSISALRVDTDVNPPAMPSPSPVNIPSTVTPSIPAPKQEATNSPLSVDESGSEKPRKKNRCFSCKKKVGLTGFECRCGGLYCGLHRYSNEHGCTFDYKKEGREQLAKVNPLVVGEKVKKI